MAVVSAKHVGMIWAQDAAGVIGADGGMLWRVPDDFRHFRASTLGCGLVMGRATWDSLGGALAKRRNVVLTRQRGWSAEGALAAPDLASAIALAGGDLDAELGPDQRVRAGALPRVWIIGGGSVYAQAMDADAAELLLVSTLDLAVDAPDGAVRAPRIDTSAWARDTALSDPEGAWRAVSGDAAWRVDAWRRR
ncbi:dihydrofolate reductase [Actinomyces gaoshouyii]|uniref:dihydrofolate reductase n=1 Tax=Actinomyces gaoshouyii TaxID=1960083 RepID=UPI001E4D1E40|nr:dihydrofolate reductase [Actinomyces gaoshouyii]